MLAPSPLLAMRAALLILGCARGSALTDTTSARPALRLRGGAALIGPLSPGALFNSYSCLLAAAPLQTNTITAAGLAVLSDSIAQKLEPSSAGYDRERGAWMLVWGAGAYGALVHYWMIFLTWLWPHARTQWAHTIGKVATNQATLSPALNAIFFAFVIWTRTKPRLRIDLGKRQQLMFKYRADLLPTCLRSTGYWACMQTINFRVIPMRFSVLWVNCAFVFWTTFLSLIGNRVNCDDDGCK